MFRKVLIANRGEIAIRVARACRELGVATVGVYSEADRDALHRAWMDEDVLLGPAPAAESYLHVDRILTAAAETGAEAIHPGYGFLAEDASFVERCEEAGLVFVGPGSRAMALSGDKIASRKAMGEAGLSVTTGTDAALEDEDEARAVAAKIGYPVIFKGTAAGGGIGMAVVRREEDIGPAFRTARAAAEASFGRPDVFLEKYLVGARHIEVQVLFDRSGRGVHLGERECSIQRRHQKLIEEAPSPAIAPAQRRRLGELALRGLRSIGYTNAGTVEFLYADGRFHFNEINARLQVEHPVTELVTGVDIVQEQIRIAAGEGLSVRQEEVRLRGWAMECRINAEDPLRQFLPSPGRIGRYIPPGGPGIRLDSGVAAGSEVSAHYDPLVAKLLAYGRDRGEAVARMGRALREFRVEGIATNLPFHRAVLADEAFLAGRYDTGFVETSGVLRRLRAEASADEVGHAAAIASVLAADPTVVARLRRRLALRVPDTSRWALAGRADALQRERLHGPSPPNRR
jgi:acetyl-CoA carboxylase biotin carboxylase subunit